MSTELFGDSTLRILLLGIWLPIFLLFAIGFAFYRFNKSREYGFADYQRRLEENQYRDEFERRRLLEKTLEEISSRSKSAEAEIERLHRLLQERFLRLERTLLRSLRTASTKLMPAITNSDNGMLRELSHALYTPLSRVVTLSQNSIADSDSEVFRERMESSIQAVHICYAYLSSYRTLIDVKSQALYWNPESMKDALSASAQVYAAKSGKQIDFNIGSPSSLPNYSNAFVLACILPLIENATEAVVDGDTVNVNIVQNVDWIVVEVSNILRSALPPGDIWEAGITSKKFSRPNCRASCA